MISSMWAKLAFAVPNRISKEEIMKETFVLLMLLSGGLLTCAHAKTNQQFQSARVVSVDTHETPSNYVGDSPMDAPLQADVHSYDIGIRVDCTVYTVRYESGLDYLPSVFTLNHAVTVGLGKHVMNVALPGDREIKLGIVYRSRAKDATCSASK
jgi:hypothetical protein